MSKENLITLFLMNNTAYVWNSDDWMRIRESRIMGNFIGSLAALPRQDLFEGLPLALLPEETTLLLEKKLVRLLEVSNISEVPCDEIVDKCKKFREDNLANQVEIFKNLRKKEIESKLDLIIKGREAKRKGGEGKDEPLNREEILLNEISKIQPPSNSYLGVQIFSKDPWIDEKDCHSCLWKYPSNNEEKLHYLTYKNLYDRGYYITPGGKFGANYLAYPGDPSKFHAFFIVICVDKKSIFKPNQIIAYGRLGQAVRKTVALAYLSDSGEVCFQSIQWLGS